MSRDGNREIILRPERLKTPIAFTRGASVRETTYTMSRKCDSGNVPRMVTNRHQSVKIGSRGHFRRVVQAVVRGFWRPGAREAAFG